MNMMLFSMRFIPIYRAEVSNWGPGYGHLWPSAYLPVALSMLKISENYSIYSD